MCCEVTTESEKCTILKSCWLYLMPHVISAEYAKQSLKEKTCGSTFINNF